ncbi:hypothetical protein CH256_03870 [Rhodococcus sp. 05-2254-6]|uniref:GTP pyrophosphokinase n=1 Tax=Rhodococcus sp. 05-2254-6 TaxID=2022489 RepID=UPI000B9A535F|nr:hypothetical protein [Rhodococcus sp. 05-2254-6]OZE42360.1 hypothetical protein CH256_03870 [Rhodococcus sp. 05-2254-6]
MTELMPSAATSDLPTVSFNYEQFKTWYELVKVRRLGPALSTVERYLNEAMIDNLGEFDRGRIRISSSRLKAPGRVWSKLNQEKYITRISELEDIPHVIDDLVGIRIVCNNVSDIGTVQTMLSSLPEVEDSPNSGIVFESKKERLYHETPKESGYRAYHVNLSARVQNAADWWTVSVEVQVRTLLQDGWGELTHEDTYKPDASLPPMIKTLAQRLANLLSCVDELAQDLRDELDRASRTPAATNSVATEIRSPQIDSSHSASSVVPDSSGVIFPEQALIEETRETVRNLSKPETLAAVAFQLQSVFGASIAQQSWGRFGTFKSLLLEAVPDVNIVYVGPGWIVPRGFDASDLNDTNAIPANAFDPSVPNLIRELQKIEKPTPAVSKDELRKYISAVAASLDQDLWDELNINRTELGVQQVHLLSKAIRDKVQRGGKTLIRLKLSYFLNALLQTGNLRTGLSTSQLRDIFFQYIRSRAGHFNIPVDEHDLLEIEQWIDPESSFSS